MATILHYDAFSSTSKANFSRLFFKNVASNQSAYNNSVLVRRKSYKKNFAKTTLLSPNYAIIHDRFRLMKRTRKIFFNLFEKNYTNSVFFFNIKNFKKRKQLRLPKKFANTKFFSEKTSRVNVSSSTRFFAINRSLNRFREVDELLTRSKVPHYKSKKQNLAKINSFNRVWFRLFFKNFFKNFSSLRFRYRLYLKKTLQRFIPKGLKLKAYKKNFSLFFYKNVSLTLLNFLTNELFFKNVNFSIFFIENSLVSVNNVVVTNPFFKINFNSVVRLNINPIFFFLIVFSLRKLLVVNKNVFNFKSYFKRFRLSQNIVSNFNLLEFFIFFDETVSFNSRIFRRDFLFRKFRLDQILYQFFFKKQSRLKAGR